MDQRTPEQRVRDRVSRRLLIGWDDAGALLEENEQLRAETERALAVLIDENEQLRGLLRTSARKTVFFRRMWRLGNEKRVELRRELERYRSTRTIGGPPPQVTPGWVPGDSSRPPTAPPEEIVVALPVSDCEVRDE